MEFIEFEIVVTRAQFDVLVIEFKVTSIGNAVKEEIEDSIFALVEDRHLQAVSAKIILVEGVEVGGEGDLKHFSIHVLMQRG